MLGAAVGGNEALTCIFLDKIWTRSAKNGVRKAFRHSQRTPSNGGISSDEGLATFGFAARRAKRKPHRLTTDGAYGIGCGGRI